MRLVRNAARNEAPVKSNDILRMEATLRAAVRTARRSFGSEHVGVALCLIQLADLYQHEQRFVEAEVVYRQAAEIYETLGIGHELLLAIALRSLALTLCAQQRHAEAAAVSAKATRLILEFQ